MNKQKENMLVPKLRFPEFMDEGEWKVKKLIQFLTESRLSGSKGNVAKKITVKLWGKGVFEKNDEIQGSINTQYYKRKAGQFIYSKLDFLNQAFGIIPIHLDNYESTVDLPCFDINIEINSVFLLEYVKRRDFYEKLGETADGSRKARRIHADTFLSFPIYIPHINEQQKIATCLSTLDELIDAENKKLEALKVHKKGLMQQLFPAEGETVPKLRFKEFRESGEWEEKTLGEIGEFIGGGTPSKNNESYWKGNIPWISSSDIFEDNIHKINITRYITEEALTNSATKRVPANSILIVSRVGVGKVAITNKDLCTSQDFTSFTPFDSYVVFLAYYIKSLSKILLSFSQGMAIKGFTKEDISNLELFLPIFTEQQKIASCLSSLDELIETQSQKIESLKLHKKGLMQGLFPAVNEGIE